MSKINLKWKPTSWRDKPAKHQPIYRDPKLLENATKELAKFPPLVFAGEARN